MSYEEAYERYELPKSLTKYYNIIIFVKLILCFAGKFCIYKYFIEYEFSYCIKYVKKSIILR